jgi:peroxiredoxin
LELIPGSLTPPRAGWQAADCHPGYRLAGDCGAWRKKNSYGKKSLGISRASFLIDAAGKIMAAW